MAEEPARVTVPPLSFVIPVDESLKGSPARREWIRSLDILAKRRLAGVEFSLARPQEVDAPFLAEALAERNLAVSGLGTGRAFITEGLCISNPDRRSRLAAVDRVSRHATLARILKTRVIIGLIRGLANPGDRRDLLSRRKALLDSMGRICEDAGEKGVEVLLEPLNRYETSFVNTAAEGRAFVKENGRPNLKLLLDTFHMNIEEKDARAAILATRKLLGHFHLADSNRFCPGRGHIDFRGVLAALKAVRYRGFAAAEFTLEANLSHSARDFVNYMKKI